MKVRSYKELVIKPLLKIRNHFVEQFLTDFSAALEMTDWVLL